MGEAYIIFQACLKSIMFGNVIFKFQQTLRSGILPSISRSFHLSSIMSSKVAVVLSGCGVYDGSEIHEASAVLVHLSRAGASVSMFAPDKKQMHVIDHTKGAEMDQERNVMVESARIARGQIAPLTELKAADYDAVIFPGGFGAAKNLSDFAIKGPELSLDPAAATHVDAKNKVVTAPAYMCETAVHEIFDGIGKMVDSILSLHDQNFLVFYLNLFLN